MVDFFKFSFNPPDFINWQSEVDLDFKLVKSINVTTKLGTPLSVNFYECKHNGYKITRKQTFRVDSDGTIDFEENSIYIEGSLHKSAKRSMSYEKGENFSRFSLSEITNEITFLSSRFHFNPNRAILLNLEYGFNLQMPESPKNFIRANLFLLQGKFFAEFESSGQNKLGSVIAFQRFSFKVYDKGYQYGLKYNLLRVEIKFHKLKALKEMGVQNLTDLLNPERLKLIHQLFMKKWNKVILYDDKISGLSKKQMDFYSKCGQRGYLEGLYEKKDPKRFNYMAKLKTLNRLNGESRFKYIGDSLNNEFEYCLNN